MLAEKTPRRFNPRNVRSTDERKYSRAIQRRIAAAVSIFLIFCLLSGSTLAAPQTLMSTAAEWKAGLVYWSRVSGVPSKIYRALTGQSGPQPKAQEKQRDRD